MGPVILNHLITFVTLTLDDEINPDVQILLQWLRESLATYCDELLLQEQ